MIMTDSGAIDVNKIPLKITLGEEDATGLPKIEGIQVKINAAIDAYNTEYKTKIKDFKEIVKDDYTLSEGAILYVDYYVKASSGVKQIDIEAGKFGGSYYLEASTLWRDQATGDDYPAEFIIPNCKVQSNFTFTMAPTGDPSESYLRSAA